LSQTKLKLKLAKNILPVLHSTQTIIIICTKIRIHLENKQKAKSSTLTKS